eukprot:CAMPEP_0175133980 /NCGR_PEP_ID=MMETSP0087-20121206/7936_1 /TAXON_ID=136419 /ORGANISM="Unknown Unknown, Strain D1" /LENGTH=143 /DNA_ID=CAMNT_0016416515 /DNA_START=276 /DNA_END=707 /DNA_ORIENTATION=-
MVWFYFCVFWACYGGIYSCAYPLTFLNFTSYPSSWLFLVSLVLGIPSTWLMFSQAFFAFLHWRNHPDPEEIEAALAALRQQREPQMPSAADAAGQGFDKADLSQEEQRQQQQQQQQQQPGESEALLTRNSLQIDIQDGIEVTV